MAGDRPYEVVAQFWHPNDAGPYLSALANEGIEADLLDEQFSMLRTGLEFMSGGTKVIVAREDAARARELLGDDPAAHGAPEAVDFSGSDLTRARIARECPACASKSLRSPHRPALTGTIVLAIMTAAFTTSLPAPGWVPLVIAAFLIPVYYRILFGLMPMWQCNACQARWEMPRN